MYLKVSAVAKLLSLSERQVYRLIKSGDIPSIKLKGTILVKEDELEQHLSSLKVEVK
ncbi:helix-turn-helix domain-containing protein [Staphylococcus hyicus]|uniref:helix-turn-helix domain-containing protein n=1 Tax=Staphylococcus hyicus TaxID=1284 RepID=UPI0031329FAD